METLTKQEKKFVQEVVETGNKTQSVIKAFPEVKSKKYARVKGHRLITKDNIKNAIQTFADKISDDKLFKVFDEGLEATKMQGVGGMAIGIEKGEVSNLSHQDMFVPDYPTRHKYLVTGLDLKGYLKTGNQTNVQVNINRFKEYE